MGVNDFMETKKIIGRGVLLTYPNFSEKFIIHPYSSNINTGRVISQHVKPIGFFLRKLAPTQINYIIT